MRLKEDAYVNPIVVNLYPIVPEANYGVNAPTIFNELRDYRRKVDIDLIQFDYS